MDHKIQCVNTENDKFHIRNPLTLKIYKYSWTEQFYAILIVKFWLKSNSNSKQIKYRYVTDCPICMAYH